MGRVPCCEKVGLKKGRWTAEEDQILTSYILAHGEGSWRSLPKNAGLLRCGKSCRLRWINYLRADLKRGNITQEEEETIVKLHNALGNRWSLIASHLTGRTDNEIKNYWNSHLSRKMYSFIGYKNNGSLAIPTSITNKIAPCKRSKGGRSSSRSGMKRQKLAFKLTGNYKPESREKEAEVMHEQVADREKSSPSSNNNNNNNNNNNDTDTIVQIEDRQEKSCLGSGGITHQPEREANGGGELRPSITKEGENEALLGPYEWLDSEIKRLKDILQSGGSNGDGHHHQDPSGLILEGKNGGVITATRPQVLAEISTSESSSDVWNSWNGECSGEWHSRLLFEQEYWLDDWDSTVGVDDVTTLQESFWNI